MEGMLKISEAANLAIHAMVYMLRAGDSSNVSVAEIAEALAVSKDHLGKVLQRLTRMGLVSSKRGPRGGFMLSREPAAVTLLEVIEAVDGPLPRSTCLLGRPICGESGCILGSLMHDIQRQVTDYLSSTTLGDMRGAPLGQRGKGKARRR